MNYAKHHLLHGLFVCLVLLFVFMYFIGYRTESRVAWYIQMDAERENFIRDLRQLLNIGN